MTTDPTTAHLVHTTDAAIHVEHHTYPTAHGPLRFDLYRPDTRAPVAAIVFVMGFPDPGNGGRFGKSMLDWTSYQDWARLVAAEGMAAITYENRVPADIDTIVQHVRAHGSELGIDPARIGVWACSGHGPTALGVIARERIACAALLYPYLLDVDGATHVAAAGAMFPMGIPAVTIDELPRAMPMLIARARRDQMPGLDESLQRFVAAARARALPLTVADHPEAVHAFDLVEDSPRTHEVIREVLAFLRRSTT